MEDGDGSWMVWRASGNDGDDSWTTRKYARGEHERSYGMAWNVYVIGSVSPLGFMSGLGGVAMGWVAQGVDAWVSQDPPEYREEQKCRG